MRTPTSTIALLALACSTACSSAATGPNDAGPTADAAPADVAVPSDAKPDAGPIADTHGVLVIGTLANPDLNAAQQQHDAIAAGGETPAKSAGDVGHAVMLGTNILGTTEHEFLALDRWSAGANIDSFYGNPDFVKAFGSLFSAPPSRGIYVKRTTWATWASVDAANDTDPHYWVVVRGTLKSATDATNQATHDQIVGGTKQQAMGAGDLGHVVYTGRDDARSFVAIDVWRDATPIAAFYGNPQLQQAFGQLFEGAPTVGVYASTHWHQW